MAQASAQIPKRSLGNTGVQISCIGMGCSPFGHAYGVGCRIVYSRLRRLHNLSFLNIRLLQSPDETKAVAAVQEAFKSGVNFFDIAPFYASGDAERVSGIELQYFCCPVRHASFMSCT